MENILVGVIVAAALFYYIKKMIKAFKGQTSCSCGCEGCSLSVPGKQACNEK